MSNNFVDTTVYEGRVLLTGVVDSANKAKLAQDLAWQVEGVLEVIDEIQVCDNCKMKIRQLKIMKILKTLSCYRKLWKMLIAKNRMSYH
jgi:hypothetical protein